MKTVFKRSPLSSIPSYSQNAVMQLIIASSVGFIMYGLIKALMYLTDTELLFGQYITANVALPSIDNYPSKFWTILTYGWIHAGFWEILTQMLWLYAFGSVFQGLMGYRQVIPLFVYAIIIGGAFYLLGQFIPGQNIRDMYMLGAHAGIMAFAAGALTISPRYRFFITEHFSVPLAVIAGIFVLLMFLYTGMLLPRILLLIGGAVTGFGYVKLLRAGYKPGEWAYSISGKVESLFTPDDNKIAAKKAQRRNKVKSIYDAKSHKQKTIDDILDKINQKGYNSLSNEEKEMLFRASKENK